MKKILALLLALSVSATTVSAATPQQKNPQAGIVSTLSTGLNIRSAGSISSMIITSITRGSHITLLEQDGDWWKVEYADGQFGYVHADYISPISESEAKIVSTISTNLNVRSGAGTTYSVIGSLVKGKQVIVLSNENGWSRILFNGNKIGFVASEYLTSSPIHPSEQPSTPEDDSNHNNSNNGNNSNQENNSNTGTPVVPEQKPEQNQKPNDTTSSTPTPPTSKPESTPPVSTPETTPTYQAIQLNVLDFKQTDDRWANVVIGNHGQNLGQIGCTTVTLAMTESYRTGSTITPDLMAQRLSYSAGGALYWPTNYTVTTDSTNYLERIYNLLKKGTPVIVGAKNSSGKQHWVVVKGFKGGNQLTPSGFIVNDPGSNYRNNLQQLFDLHPTFYKIAYAN